nr:paramyosin, long form isoform X1 [Ipomoea batatas]
MAAEEENDDMASLFEGMVLFDPSEMVGPGHLDQQPSTTAATLDVGPDQPAALPLTAESSPSQPLDENLFSDLTLVSPSQSLELEDIKSNSDPSSISLISRQNSTRKKKRAGLRIGYGRDRDRYHVSDSVIATSTPNDHSHIDTRFTEAEEKKKELADDDDDDEDDDDDDGGGEEEDQEPYSSSTISAAQDRDSSSDTTSHGIHSNDTPEQTANLASSGVGEDATTGQLDVSKSHDPVEFRFQQLRILISNKLKEAHETVASISSERKESIRMRRKAARSVTQAYAEYKEFEKKLEEACEAEDFEKAERVSESLASTEKEKECLVVALRDAEAHCDAVDSKMQGVLESLIQVEEECASMLQTFAMDTARDADLVLKNAEGLSSKQMQEWDLSAEAIEIKKMELEIEAELVDEARKVLNDSIEQFVEDDRRERDFLCRKKEGLTEELKKLLALVKEKEEEIAENDSLIEKVDKRIAGAVSRFKEVQTNMDQNYHNLQSGLSELELANESLLEKKKEIDYYASQEESREAKIRDLSRISADEANMFQEFVELRKSLAQLVLKSKEDKVRLSKTEDELSMHVQMLKHGISTARTSLQELSSTKSKIQQEVDSLNQRLVFIDKRVPELEAEKKVAATARNFKEAARLSAEAKALCNEKDEIQTKLEVAELELKKVEEEICQTVDKLQETEVQISSREKELAMARFQRLILIDRASRAERSAALELGDLEEADALLEEAEAADAEARKLQPIYNLKEEELANLPKHFVSAELVSKIQGKQLIELAESVSILGAS